MACLGWVRQQEGNSLGLDDFPNLTCWFAALSGPLGGIKGIFCRQEDREGQKNPADGKEARKILFGRTAR